jgi:pimeloyl-ACP methyl ester carboxylesterase
MAFFNAYKATVTKVPTYFIESTAPNNVDDRMPSKPKKLDNLTLIPDSNDAIKMIACDLAGSGHPNLVVMVHGFNNPLPDVLSMYTSAAIAVNDDQEIQKAGGVVCVGYRWPSERMGQPLAGTWDALPQLPTRILYLGLLLAAVPFLVFYLVPGGERWIADMVRSICALAFDHFFTMMGLTFVGLILTAALLRTIVYFRDNYRASNYGIPDLIQIIRAIDEELLEQHYQGRKEEADLNRAQLSFIGHSMGAFVVTNAIRTLSDVFATPVKSLNAFGATAPVPSAALQKLGKTFMLKRFVLASPDIPAEALLANRGNFLASVLSRFEEAYLFSNEGDEVLRQISTLANYFVFPTKNSNHGFRLGNVEILSRGFGIIPFENSDDFLRKLRVGNLTLQQLNQRLVEAEAHRQGGAAAAEQLRPSPLPEVFTYFDCTDYVDLDNEGKTRPLLTFAQDLKRNDAKARMPFHSHLRLLFAYLFWRRPNVHGGYFEGVLSQKLIYRLACLGFHRTMSAFESEAKFGEACKEKQIRVMISPALQDTSSRPAVAKVRSD